VVTVFRSSSDESVFPYIYDNQRVGDKKHSFSWQFLAFGTGQRMAGKNNSSCAGALASAVYHLPLVHERFTRNYQGVSHAKWLKANYACAPIRTGNVTRTPQPVDVERRAYRANEISKRAKNL
jgi:hypothetical protein